MRADRAPRPLVALAAVVALALPTLAVAHATLVFGTVTTEPTPAPAGTPLTVDLVLSDPTDTPVEDAVVHVEAERQRDAAAGPAADDAAAGLVVSDRFEEVEPGRYRTELLLPDAGAWTLTFRDRTFRQEEARASVTMVVGPAGQGEPLSFIFPPTATGPQSLTTWLVWLIGLPLVAGAVVTVMVLRGRPGADAPAAAADAGASGDPGADDGASGDGASGGGAPAPRDRTPGRHGRG